MIGIPLFIENKMRIFLLLFFVNSAIPALNNPNIEIDIVSFHIADNALSITYSIKNNTAQLFWLPKDTGSYSCEKTGNIVWFVPVYDFYDSGWEGVGYNPKMQVDTIRINPGETRIISFTHILKPETPSIILESGTFSIPNTAKVDVEFINITLVLLENNISNPILPRAFKKILIEQGVFICKMLKVGLPYAKD